MPTDNSVTLVGNVTRDPELRFTNTGQATCSFGLAVNRRWQNRQTQEWEEATSFFDVVCWREMAENVSETLTRGARVMVTGRLEQRSWETQEGDRRSKVEVVADEIGPSLRWATAQVTKNERRGPGDGGGAWRLAVVAARRQRRRPAAPAGGGGGAAAVTDSTRSLSDGTEQRPRDGVDAGRPRISAAGSRRSPAPSAGTRSTWVDYKDVPMLRKYMSDRGKIRSRRVTGNCAQHQRALAMAIKTARELVLLPYTQRTVTERPGGRAWAAATGATAATGS